MTALRRRWRGTAILVAALTGISITSSLGFWQLGRAAQKEAMQRSLEERSGLPALNGTDLANDADAAPGQHHRAVRLQGRWLVDQTVYLDNRPMNGRAGFIVITPLLCEPGPRAVLVQRGWIARDARERTRLPDFATPSGRVDVVGEVAAPPSRLFEFDGAESGPIRQNLDLAEYARETRLALHPLSVLQADSPSTSGDGLLRQWPRPAVDVHKNYGYAAQWFALAVLMAGLYVWFQLIQPGLHAH